MTNFLHLTDVGAQTAGGKRMAGYGEDSHGESKGTLGDVEESFAHFRGRGGMRWQDVGGNIAVNIAYMSKDIFDQSIRAVKGESAALQQDEEGFQGLAAPQADNENVGSVLRTNINIA